MKIAIISDVHGNIEALKETIKDIEKRNVDKIFCLGDTIAKGIHQNACVDLIREKCDVVIQGNCDKHFSSDIKDKLDLPEMEMKRFKWNQSLVSEENRNYLQGLPFCYEFYMSGSLIRLFHATNRAINKVVCNHSTIEEKYDMFLPSEYTISDKPADVVIYGHIHHQYMEKIYNKTLINVGSVGNSFDVIRNDKKDSNVMETTKACYLIIEGEYGSRDYNAEISFQFIKVPYDIDKELENQDNNIEKENYYYELKQGKYRNMAKIYDSYRKLGIKLEE